MNISSASSLNSFISNSLETNYQEEVIQSVIEEIAQELRIERRLTFFLVKEMSENKFVCCLKLDLSNSYQGLTNEDLLTNNELLATQINQVFQSVNERVQNLELAHSCIFSILDLSHNYISERMFLSRHEEESYSVNSYNPIFSNIESLNLNYTEISSGVLDYLTSFKELRILKMEECRRLQNLTKPLFDYTFSQLNTLHLVNTHFPSLRDDLLLERIEEIFPQVSQIDLTQTGGKFLGMIDTIQEEFIIHPMISMKCGHIFSQTIAENEKFKECMTCCQPLEGWVEGRFAATRYSKIEGKWKPMIVDFNRKLLKGRVYFHPPCHHFFTEQTLKSLFGLEKYHTNNKSEAKDFIDELHDLQFACPGCSDKQKLKLIRVYPNSSQEENLEENFQQLSLKTVAEHLRS